MEYKILTAEEKEAIGENMSEVAICVEENQIVAMITLNVNKRMQNCDNCTMSCAEGFISWVKRGYRGQGLHPDLHEWFREQLGVKGPLYFGLSETIDPSIAAIYWDWNIKEPRGFEYTPGASQYDNEKRTYDYVQRISPILGYEVD
jgi:hypothetical protein